MKHERDFYERSTLDVARDLLGQVLVRDLGEREGILAGRIVEAEAYLGPQDRASHAARKNPKRARMMYGPPGYSYIYPIYYTYYCLNLVTEPEGTAGAVLIRAVQPLEGIEAMRRNRGKPMPDANLTSGPSKLCMAFSIDTELHGLDLCGETLWVEDRELAPAEVRTGPRIGVDYAGEWATKPYRFWEAGSAYLSRRS